MNLIILNWNDYRITSRAHECFQRSQMDQKRKLMDLVFANLALKEETFCYSFKNPSTHWQNCRTVKNGAHDRIRTYDLWIRNPTLYPTELRVQMRKLSLSRRRDICEHSRREGLYNRFRWRLQIVDARPSPRPEIPPSRKCLRFSGICVWCTSRAGFRCGGAMNVSLKRNSLCVYTQSIYIQAAWALYGSSCR